MMLHITEAKYLTDYKVQVVFNDGKEGVADLSDALRGPVFDPLKDKKFCVLIKKWKRLLGPMGQIWLQNMFIIGLLKTFLNYRSNFKNGDIKIRKLNLSQKFAIWNNKKDTSIN